MVLGQGPGRPRLGQGPGRSRLLELPSQRQGLLLEGCDLAALVASANRIDFFFFFVFLTRSAGFHADRGHDESTRSELRM